MSGNRNVSHHVLGRPAEAKTPPFIPTAAGGHKLVPLRFDPAKLPGLSEKLLTSHSRSRRDTPGFQGNALRERELTYANSVYLHVAYFENLGGNGKVAGEFSKALVKPFGSAARREEQLRATAMSTLDDDAGNNHGGDIGTSSVSPWAGRCTPSANEQNTEPRARGATYPWRREPGRELLNAWHDGCLRRAA